MYSHRRYVAWFDHEDSDAWLRGIEGAFKHLSATTTDLSLSEPPNQADLLIDISPRPKSTGSFVITEALNRLHVYRTTHRARAKSKRQCGTSSRTA